MLQLYFDLVCCCCMLNKVFFKQEKTYVGCILHILKRVVVVEIFVRLQL